MSTTTAAVGDRAVTDPPLPARRGVGFVLVLTIVTLGLYQYYWLYKTFREVKAYRGTGIGGLLGIVATLFVVGVFLLPWYVGRMIRDAERAGSVTVTAWTGLWVLIPFVGAFIWVARVQSALNDFIEAQEEVATARHDEAGKQVTSDTPAAYLRAELRRVGVAPPSADAVRLGFRPTGDGSSIAVLRDESGKEWTGSVSGATSRVSTLADGAGAAAFWRAFDEG